MDAKIKRWFRAPYGMPNGVQATGDGIWVVDQVTDRAALLDVSDADEYGMLRLRLEVPTESSNTSGMAWGDISHCPNSRSAPGINETTRQSFFSLV